MNGQNHMTSNIDHDQLVRDFGFFPGLPFNFVQWH